MTILLWIHHDNIIPNGIEYHILPYESGNLCILDVSSLSVMNESKSLWLLLNFLSLSAGLLVEKSEDDQTFTRLQFLEQTMSLFHNEMNIVKSTINFPPLLLYSAAPLGAKESKKVMDTFLKPENGFSEEISKKNALRGIIDSLFHSKDLISPDSHVNDPVQLISSPNFGKRFACLIDLLIVL